MKLIIKKQVSPSGIPFWRAELTRLPADPVVRAFNSYDEAKAFQEGFELAQKALKEVDILFVH